MDAHAESEATFTEKTSSPGLAMGPAWIINDPLHWGGPVCRDGEGRRDP